jgi:hypothetical protein
MELVSFDGGLNTKAHPQYVQNNQSVVLNDADVFDGTLKSSSSHTSTGKTVGPYFTKFNGVYVSEATEASFVEYDKKLFITTETETKYTEDGVTFKTLGNNPPDPLKTLTAEPLVWDGLVSVADGTSLRPEAFEYRVVQGDNVYIADLDLSSEGREFVEVTFTITGFAGDTEVYRLSGDAFYQVGSVTGDGTIVDGSEQDIELTNFEPVSKTTFPLSIYPKFEIYSSMVFDGTLYSLYIYDTTGQGTNYSLAYLVKTVGTESTYVKVPNFPTSFDWQNAYGGKLFTLGTDVYLMFQYSASNVGGNSTNGSYLYTCMYKLDGNSLVYLPDSTRRVFISLGSSSFNRYRYHVVQATENEVYLLSLNSGTYLKYNGGYITGGNIPIITTGYGSTKYVQNVDYAVVLGVETLFVTYNTGQVHKYKIGSRDTSNSLLLTLNPKLAIAYNYGSISDGSMSLINGKYLPFIGDGEVVLYDINLGVYSRFNISKLNLTAKRYTISYTSSSDKLYISYIGSYNSYPRASGPNTAGTILELSINLSGSIGDVLSTPTLSGSFNYLYTFSNSLGGEETSISSPTSVELDASSSKLIFDNVDTTQLSHINIYRNGGDNNADPYYRLVERLELSGLTKYIDSTPTILLGAQTPPEDINNEARQDLKYLTYHRGSLWAAGQFENFSTTWVNESNSKWVDEFGNEWFVNDTSLTSADKLYFSGLGEPTQWSDTNYLLMPEAITGIGSTPNGLIVFSKTSVYAVLGSTADEFSIITISTNDGCVSNQSIQSYKGSLFYMGNYGIQVTDGGSVQNLSRIVLDSLENYVPRYSAIKDDVYYVDSSLGLLAYDFRASKLFQTFSNQSITGIENVDGNLELCYRGKLSNAFSSSQDKLHYKSGRITSGAINMLKEYTHVWVRYIGDFEFNVIIDGNVINTITLTSLSETTHRYNVPKTSAKGYSIQFELIGIGNILGIEFNHNLRKD